MKKLYFLIAVLVIVFIFFAIFTKNNIKTSKNSIIPNITQSTPNNSKNTVAKIGEQPNYLFVKEGFAIGIFAENIPQARDLEFSQNGTLIVSSLQGNIYALPDKDGDGVADEVKIIISNLKRPHGIAFFNGKLYVSEETRVLRYNFNEENLSASLDKILFSLPNAGNHFTRSLLFDKNGKLYISIGSTCNVCFEKDQRHATVLVTDKDGKDTPKVFAKGLRNSVFLTLNPKTEEIWATDMGRDGLGDNLPPDEINIIKEGMDYGWPVCYGNKIYDKNFKAGNPNQCQKTVAPVYEIPAHSAPLGLTFIESGQFPDELQGNLLVSYHGSWNRSIPDGYKVVIVNINKNTEEDFITGFLPANGKNRTDAIARPVDLAFDKQGSLYVSDDRGGMIYKVVKK